MKSSYILSFFILFFPPWTFAAQQVFQLSNKESVCHSDAVPSAVMVTVRVKSLNDLMDPELETGSPMFL